MPKLPNLLTSLNFKSLLPIANIFPCSLCHDRVWFELEFCISFIQSGKPGLNKRRQNVEIFAIFDDTLQKVMSKQTKHEFRKKNKKLIIKEISN